MPRGELRGAGAAGRAGATGGFAAAFGAAFPGPRFFFFSRRSAAGGAGFAGAFAAGGFAGGACARGAGGFGGRGGGRGSLHGGLFGAGVGGRRDFRGALGHRVGDAAAAARAEAHGEQRRAGRERDPSGQSGPMRRAQVGQSLRSFCASWSHHGQKRRFSTDHGSRDGEGASGSTLPTTSSGSSDSRSR